MGDYADILKKKINKNNLLSDMESDQTIVRHELLEALFKGSNLTGLKILFYIAKAKILQPPGKNLLSLKLDMKRLNDFAGTTNRTIARNLKQMQKTTITFRSVENKNEVVEYISMIPRIKIIEGINQIELDIYSDVYNLIANVGKNFSVIDVDLLLTMHSKYSLRMLMILERIKNFGEKVAKRKIYELDELNAMFDTRYKRLGEFERNVLKVVQEDLSLSQSKLNFLYTINYKKQKRGRPKATSVTIDLVKNERLLF